MVIAVPITADNFLANDYSISNCEQNVKMLFEKGVFFGSLISFSLFLR